MKPERVKSRQPRHINTNEDTSCSALLAGLFRTLSKDVLAQCPAKAQLLASPPCQVRVTAHGADCSKVGSPGWHQTVCEPNNHHHRAHRAPPPPPPEARHLPRGITLHGPDKDTGSEARVLCAAGGHLRGRLLAPDMTVLENVHPFQAPTGDYWKHTKDGSPWLSTAP